MVDKRDEEEKSKKNKKDEFEFEDDFDFDFDDNLNFDEDSITNTREPVSGQVFDAVKDTFNADFFASLARKTASTALPESYVATTYELGNFYGSIRNELQKDITGLKQTAYQTTKLVNKLLPLKLGFLEKLEEKLKPESKYKGPTEDQVREQAAASAISQVVDKQIDSENQKEALRQAREEAQDNRYMIINKQKIDLLADISSHLSVLRGFNLDIAREYYRKSLELQFKSYYVQVDQYRSSQEFHKAVALQLDKLVKNTALPDFVKLHNTELIEETIKRTAVSQLFNSAFGRDAYMGKLRKRIVSKIRDKLSINEEIQGIVDQLKTGLETTEDIGGTGQFIQSIFSSFLGDYISDKLGEKAGNYIREKIKNNEKFVNIGELVESFQNSPESFFKIIQSSLIDRANEYDLSDSILKRTIGKSIDAFLGDKGLFSADIDRVDITNERSIMDINKPAVFDNRVYGSITEAIPSLLAKILMSVREGNEYLYFANRDKLTDIPPSDLSSYRRRSDAILKEADNKFTYDFKTGKIVSAEERNLGISSELKASMTENREKEVFSDISSAFAVQYDANRLKEAANKETDKEQKAKLKAASQLLKRGTVKKDIERYLLLTKRQMGDNFDLEEALSIERLKELKDRGYFKSDTAAFIDIMASKEYDKYRNTNIAKDYKSFLYGNKEKIKEASQPFDYKALGRILASIARLTYRVKITFTDDEAIEIGNYMLNKALEGKKLDIFNFDYFFDDGDFDVSTREKLMVVSKSAIAARQSKNNKYKLTRLLSLIDKKFYFRLKNISKEVADILSKNRILDNFNENELSASFHDIIFKANLTPAKPKVKPKVEIDENKIKEEYQKYVETETSKQTTATDDSKFKSIDLLLEQLFKAGERIAIKYKIPEMNERFAKRYTGIKLKTFLQQLMYGHTGNKKELSSKEEFINIYKDVLRGAFGNIGVPETEFDEQVKIMLEELDGGAPTQVEVKSYEDFRKEYIQANKPETERAPRDLKDVLSSFEKEDKIKRETQAETLGSVLSSLAKDKLGEDIVDKATKLKEEFKEATTVSKKIELSKKIITSLYNKAVDAVNKQYKVIEDQFVNLRKAIEDLDSMTPDDIKDLVVNKIQDVFNKSIKRLDSIIEIETAATLESIKALEDAKLEVLEDYVLSDSERNAKLSEIDEEINSLREKLNDKTKKVESIKNSIKKVSDMSDLKDKFNAENIEALRKAVRDKLVTIRDDIKVQLETI